MITYLHLILDTLPDKDCTGRCRMALGWLFSSMKNADLEAVITLYEPTMKKVEEKQER